MKEEYSFNNREIAAILRNVSAAYEIRGENRFKIVAYDRTATAVEHSTTDVKDLWGDNLLSTIPGVGPSIASHLDELFRTGRVKHFDRLLKGLPPAMFEFLSVPGIGSKIAFKLCKKLKITKKEGALEKLRQAAQAGRIQNIEGFGKLSEAKILESLAQFGRRERRLLLPIAYEYASQIVEHLKKCPQVLRSDPLGSLRRKNATVGDIDIAVVSNQPKKVIEFFTSFPRARQIIEAGENKARILIANDIQVDLMVEPPKSYGSLLQHFTGSKQHNIALREYALKKGMSLSEHGIKKTQNSKQKTFIYSTEKKFYEAFGMVWIPPELREDKGEIELALENKLPKLVEPKDIKGDLHIHSDFDIETSHDEGRSNLEEIHEKAVSLGYEYIALAEHNPSASKHSDVEIIDLIKRKKKIVDQFNYSREKLKTDSSKKVFIFNSLEVDIQPDGKRAVPDKALEYLDFAVVSVHSSFRMSKDKMTKRILTALDHPKVKILGHPTGRKLLEREGYEIDWDKLFAFCVKNKKFLEINCWPDRLDLPDSLIREAIGAGTKLVINTDSHEVGDMDLMQYGVWTARRGWAKNNDIINCLSYNKINSKLMAK